MKITGWIAGCAAAGLLLFQAGAAAPDFQQQLDEHRNLGKAFYENPTTANEAVTEFRKALDLAPESNREKLNYALAMLRAGQTDKAVALLKQVQKADAKLPHTWFNLGVYYRKNGEAEQAISQFEGMLKLTPNEPIAHYQLGALYKQVGRTADALAQFQSVEKLNPLLAGAHFQLYNLYRQAGRTEDAGREIRTFQQLKKQQENAAVPEDVDWCNYAEIYDPPRSVTPVPASAAPKYADQRLTGEVDAATAGLAAIDSTGRGRIDLLVWSSRGVALYRDGKNPVGESGLAGLKDVMFIAPGDFDNDGLMDLCVLTGAGPELYRNTGGKFARAAAELPKRRFERAVWIDYDHDYDLDLVLLGDMPALVRNQGSAGFADRTADFPFAKGHPVSAEKLRVDPDSKAFDLAVFYSDRAPALYRDLLGGRYEAQAYQGKPREAKEVEADFDGDGRLDIARVNADGSLHLLRNEGATDRRWVRIQLTGVKSLKLAQDALVEIKAGSLYRRMWYQGVPVTADAGNWPQLDTVRITWPNGLIQNETKKATNAAYRIEEAQRLSGSCPMIWTWDGHEFRFMTDVLGVAPLGASDGDGSYFPVNHVEYVSIPGDALKATGGAYDVRITEELSEVSYLDQVKLYAVDHPASTEIFTNDKFKSPPYPEFRLFRVSRRIYPESAHDDAGRDVRELLVKRDARYPDAFGRNELGVAEKHSLELDFGKAAPGGHATLFLNGWVDWPDGSTFRAASQASKAGLEPPVLEMQDAAGKWQTVNADMGMPAGKPKTIAVDLRFISASRKVRITTNFCVYWDEVFLGQNAEAPRVRQMAVRAESATLHFRGFSAAHIDPARKQPDMYSYAPVTPESFWNPTPGYYTRYGDVLELARDVDDKLIVMGSGDELKLRFRADELPALPAGWKRDFLLKVDGWAKDRDPNTAYSSSVEPLPFHAMSVYPYPEREHFPNDEAHRRYRREYNTRPALRLIRPLTD